MIVVRLDTKLHTLFDHPSTGHHLVHIRCANCNSFYVWTNVDTLTNPDLLKFIEKLRQDGLTPLKTSLYTYTTTDDLPRQKPGISF
jgi:hypothetical protein